jgi:positive regulator of sigma E activity
VILSVICCGVANGFGRVAVVVFVAPLLVVILVAITYPMIGEELKSSVIVVMIRFSADLIALLSPAIL